MAAAWVARWRAVGAAWRRGGGPGPEVSVARSAGFGCGRADRCVWAAGAPRCCCRRACCPRPDRCRPPGSCPPAPSQYHGGPGPVPRAATWSVSRTARPRSSRTRSPWTRPPPAYPTPWPGPPRRLRRPPVALRQASAWVLPSAPELRESVPEWDPDGLGVAVVGAVAAAGDSAGAAATADPTGYSPSTRRALSRRSPTGAAERTPQDPTAQDRTRQPPPRARTGKGLMPSSRGALVGYLGGSPPPP